MLGGAEVEEPVLMGEADGATLFIAVVSVGVSQGSRSRAQAKAQSSWMSGAEERSRHTLGVFPWKPITLPAP